MLDLIIALWVIYFVFSLFPTLFFWRHFVNLDEEKPIATQLQSKFNPDDYWDGGEVDYDTGEIITNNRPSVRHPKNRDRAYSGSAERFHDGGW